MCVHGVVLLFVYTFLDVVLNGSVLFDVAVAVFLCAWVFAVCGSFFVVFFDVARLYYRALSLCHYHVCLFCVAIMLPLPDA